MKKKTKRKPLPPRNTNLLPMYKGKRSDEWRTPPELIRSLKGYNFTFDLAADYDNAIVDNYYSKKDSAFYHEWKRTRGTYWLNPPFSYSYYFFRKAARSPAKIVAIYKSTNLETKVWQRYILPTAEWLCFLKRRTAYVNPDGMDYKSPPFGSVLIGFRCPPLPELSKLGTVIHLEASRRRLGKDLVLESRRRSKRIK